MHRRRAAAGLLEQPAASRHCRRLGLCGSTPARRLTLNSTGPEEVAVGQPPHRVTAPSAVGLIEIHVSGVRVRSPMRRRV